VILRGGRGAASRAMGRVGCRGIARIGVVLGLGVVPRTVAAQEPPDTVQVADTVVADSLRLQDSLAMADTVSPDTIFHNMPMSMAGLPASYATGVWQWDRDAIMASGANTLAELFQEVPGLITLLGGDYGTPAAMSAFGQGGGGYRIVRDGFEVYAVDGAVADLQRIGLVGIQRVRLDRSLGRMVVELFTYRYDDGRPFSVVEAGTGEFDTNLLRGVYADPTALFGSVAGGLERVDTRGRGPGRDEAGNRTGSWARYQIHPNDRTALGIDFRRVSTETRVSTLAPRTSRSDLVLRGGWRIVPALTLEAYTGRSSLSVGGDPLDVDPRGGARRHHGARIGLDRGALWMSAAARLFEGELPSHGIDASGGYTRARWGGVAGRWSTESWNDIGVSSVGARAWVSPLPGATLFGAWENGDYGGREGPLMDEAGPPPLALPTGPQPGEAAITARETLRVGGVLSHWGATLGGAALYASSDSVRPLGTELDLGAPAVAGVHRNGWEAMAVLPTGWEGLTLEGSYQWWDEDGPYLPAQVYRGSFEFHRIYMDTGNLELWASLGVRGHDPMSVLVDDMAEGGSGLVTVPFYQSWYFRVQVRVVTVRLWLGMDNFTFRRNLQQYPDRLLPYARSFFALRWDMWN
jgi:hypothetical protein